MIAALENVREVGSLAAVLASYAADEGKASMASGLAAISQAAYECSDASEVPALRSELIEAYAALYQPKEEGLADLFRWHPDPEIRRRLNAELELARSRLDALLEYSP